MLQSEVDWSALPHEIVDASKAIAESGKYDDAIFAALKLIESKLQDRCHSKAIGNNLIADAFDGSSPKIEIGPPSYRGWVRDLFAGSFGFIRNDRGHKKAAAVPCRSMKACIWYLNNAALLLHLLSRDSTLQPRVDEFSISATPDQSRVQLHGANLQHVSEVMANGQTATLVWKSADIVEAVLPPSFIGDIQVYADGELIAQRYCDARAIDGIFGGVFEAAEVDIPLLADPTGQTYLTDYVGIRLNVYQSGRAYTHIFPTIPGKYKKGQFISGGPWPTAAAVGEAWYRNPASGQIRQAWNHAALFLPDALPDSQAPQLSALKVLPATTSLEPGEIITLVARGIESIGSARRDIVLPRVTWKSSASNVAHVDKSGVLHANHFGQATIRCAAGGFRASVEVAVENHMRGEKSIYFEGIPLVQQMCFDLNDNLYISNQSERIYRLQRAGGIEVALQLSKPDDTSYSIDCITIDAAGGLYLTAPHPRRVTYFPRESSHYGAGQPRGPEDDTVKKSIALTARGIVVGVMGATPGTGHILRIDDDGSFVTFPTRESAHNLAVGKDGNIYVAAPTHGAVDVYDMSGTLLKSLIYNVSTPVGAIMMGHDLSVYLAMFHSGELLRIRDDVGIETSTIASSLGNPCGLAIDSRNRIYVGDFSTGRIFIIY